MNKENRAAVKKWIKEWKEEPDRSLEIYDIDGDKEVVEIINGAKLPLIDLVFIVVKYASLYPTRYADSKKYQCHRGAARSVFDIWRMCKYYQPRTSIFNVMHELFNLQQAKKLINWKCTVLHQRVFLASSAHWTIQDIRDEFGLFLPDYESI